MADEIIGSSSDTTTPAASPAVEVVVSPAPVETPSTESPAPVEAPVEAPAAEPASPEVKEDAPKTEEAKKPDTLLGGEKKIEEAKPEEKSTEVKEGEAPAEAEKEVAELPAYEPFTLPEDVTFDAEKLTDFTKTLGEFEKTTNASHEEVQKLGQQLVDRHISEVKETMERYTAALTEAWHKQKKDDWEAFQKDPEFANRTDTVGNAALDAIATYAGNADQQKEFRDLMETRGVGNHPAMIRLLSNVMLAKAESRPLAAPQIARPMAKSKVEKMYGSKKN